MDDVGGGAGGTTNTMVMAALLADAEELRVAERSAGQTMSQE